MIDTIVSLFGQLEAIAETLAASPWALLAVFLLCMIDGFFPPVPSESLVIAVAALSAGGDGASIPILIAVAAVGAWCGDFIAYMIGSVIPLEKIPGMRGGRFGRAMEKARGLMARRGTVIVAVGRFIPIGRVVVNATAGAVAFPRGRFMIIAAVAGTLWAGYATGLGLGSGAIFVDRPLIGAVAGVLLGFFIGLIVERIITLVSKRFFPTTGAVAAKMRLDEDLSVAREEVREEREEQFARRRASLRRRISDGDEDTEDDDVHSLGDHSGPGDERRSGTDSD